MQSPTKDQYSPSRALPLQTRRYFRLFMLFALITSLSSCTRLLGYGVLLWSVDEPPIPSGTVLPVYIRSNIDKVWVVGVPGTKDKVELPLWKLDLAGNQKKAMALAEDFAALATTYAEAIQDGLPLRSEPDNSARRVYRLKLGQIVKVLEKAKGNPAMSGETPLPGDWYLVLTDDGERGYCFSYRLKLFDAADGAPAQVDLAKKVEPDVKLETMLSKAWYPEAYKDMVNNRRIELESFSDKYGFYPGQDTGLVRITLPGLSFEQPYTGMVRLRDGVWRFDGTTVQATLRSPSVLGVQYNDANGAQKSYVFVALPADAKDYIAQETERRATLYDTLYQSGPSFISENYGTLTLTPGSFFTWTGTDLLIPGIIPDTAGSTGTIELRTFLDPTLESSYNGVLSLHFDGLEKEQYLHFLYALTPDGVILEFLPRSSLEGALAKRRSTSPLIISFTRAGS